MPSDVKQFLAKDISGDISPMFEFGRDLKLTCTDDTVHVNGIGDVLINWGGNETETNGLSSKEFSFKWEDPIIDKPVETRVFEVTFLTINCSIWTDTHLVFLYLAESLWSRMARKSTNHF